MTVSASLTSDIPPQVCRLSSEDSVGLRTDISCAGGPGSNLPLEGAAPRRRRPLRRWGKQLHDETPPPLLLVSTGGKKFTRRRRIKKTCFVMGFVFCTHCRVTLQELWAVFPLL